MYICKKLKSHFKFRFVLIYLILNFPIIAQKYVIILIRRNFKPYIYKQVFW